MTATVIEPAGPALTTTVRFPGLGTTEVDGTLVVVGAELVDGTVVVEVTAVVVGALDVVGALLVDGVTVVDGVLLVVGESLVVGLSDVVAALKAGASSMDAGCTLNATAAVSPIHTAIDTTEITNLRGTILDLLLFGALNVHPGRLMHPPPRHNREIKVVGRA